MWAAQCHNVEFREVKSWPKAITGKAANDLVQQNLTPASHQGHWSFLHLLPALQEDRGFLLLVLRGTNCPEQTVRSEIAESNFLLQKQLYGFSWNYQAHVTRRQRGFQLMLLSVHVWPTWHYTRVSLMHLGSIKSWTPCASVSDFSNHSPAFNTSSHRLTRHNQSYVHTKEKNHTLS